MGKVINFDLYRKNNEKPKNVASKEEGIAFDEKYLIDDDDEFIQMYKSMMEKSHEVKEM